MNCPVCQREMAGGYEHDFGEPTTPEGLAIRDRIHEAIRTANRERTCAIPDHDHGDEYGTPCDPHWEHPCACQVEDDTIGKAAADARDGAALRRLREAIGEDWRLHPAGDGWTVEALTNRSVAAWSNYYGATIAEAADKCREALTPG